MVLSGAKNQSVKLRAYTRAGYRSQRTSTRSDKQKANRTDEDNNKKKKRGREDFAKEGEAAHNKARLDRVCP